MRSVRVRHTRMLVVLLLGVAACSGGGSGGGPLSCGSGCMQPLAAPYDGPKENNAVNAKIAGAGFDYLNSNWQQLLSAFTTNPLHIPVPCITQNVSVIGDVLICDQNLNQQCDPGEGCNDVYITIDNFALTPGDPPQANQGKITGTATLEIQTGNIMVDTAGNDCLFEPLECHVNFDTTRASPPTNTLTLDVILSLEATPDALDPTHPLLKFDIQNVQGIDSIDSNDLELGGENTCGDVGCGLANIGFIKDFIVSIIKSYVQSNLQSILASQTCRKCGSGQPACPSGQNGGTDSTCDSNNHCVYASPGDGACIPLALGIEGLVQPGQLLGKYGVPADASLAISALAGGSISSAGVGSPGTGVTLGVIGGTQSETGDAPHVAPCVPTLQPPAGSAPAVPDFDADAPAPGYHVGIGVSDYFMNMGAYSAHQSGTMCISISGDQIQLLNTGLFKTFLPSLGLLAGSATQDAPMLVALRPLEAPTIDIGEGTYDPVTKKPIDPLITLTMHNVVIDIYALIEDRWSRLFTMTLDVQLPLSLIIDGCPQGITPAIGDLKNLITVTRAPTNSELLAEDPAVLQGLIPAVISLAQPALATALKPINVPAMNGFTLHLDGMKGIGTRGATSYDDLGIFGEIAQAGVCDSASVHTHAQIVERFIPTAEQLPPKAGEKMPWPKASVQVSADGYDGDVEYGYRVDDGLWTTFKSGPLLSVSDPRFLIQGHHTIEVRGRPAHGKGISDPSPAKVDFLVDWEPPAVKVVRDAKNQLVVQSLDNVDGPQALQFRYQVADGAFSAWGPARPLDTQAIEDSGKLTVEVRDEAGNVGRTTWRSPATVATSGIVPPAGPELKPVNDKISLGYGCSTADGASLAGLLALGLALLARRRKN